MSLLSTSARREKKPFAKRSSRNGWLFFRDSRVGDAITSSGFSGKHHPHLHEVPDRNEQGEVANDRPSPATAFTTRREQAQAEELFPDRASAETVSDDHPGH